MIGNGMVVGIIMVSLVSGEDVTKVTAKPTVKPEVPFDASRESLAMEFARTHHPEFADVLGTLRGMNQSQYEKAIVDLWQKRDQLENLKRRDPLVHDLSLEEWRNQSRITLLVARLRIKNDDRHDAELRRLLDQRIDLRIKRRVLERDRAALQMQRAEAAIEKLQSEREASINAELKRLMRDKNTKRTPSTKGTAGPDKE